MNRRNLLVSIATAAIVIGAVMGSGALTQVSAERTATVSVADDSAAAIALTANSSFVVSDDGTGNAIELSLENLNDNATTTLPAFTITNNLNEGVGAQVTTADSPTWLEIRDGSGTDLTSNWVDINDSSASDNSLTVHFVINTTDSSYANSTSVTLTVDADSTQYTG